MKKVLACILALLMMFSSAVSFAETLTPIQEKQLALIRNAPEIGATGIFNQFYTLNVIISPEKTAEEIADSESSCANFVVQLYSSFQQIAEKYKLYSALEHLVDREGFDYDYSRQCYVGRDGDVLSALIPCKKISILMLYDKINQIVAFTFMDLSLDPFIEEQIFVPCVDGYYKVAPEMVETSMNTLS